MKIPIALEPAADAGDHRVRQAGRSARCIWRAGLDRRSPAWKSRTIMGNGWGPTTEADGCSVCCRPIAIQWRIASLMASLSVRPLVTGGFDLGAEDLHAVHVQLLATNVLLSHVDHAGEAERAEAVAVATPCWPAPVSAMTRPLPMRR